MLLHIKYLYGIRVEVRGAHHFPPSQPYVVVSNHQSSLDLLGETLVEHTSPSQALPPGTFPESSLLEMLDFPLARTWPSFPHKQGGRPLVPLLRSSLALSPQSPSSFISRP